MDEQLQRAIYDSLKVTQPDSRHWGGRPAKPQPTRNNNQKHGRIDSLRRNGIHSTDLTTQSQQKTINSFKSSRDRSYSSSNPTSPSYQRSIPHNCFSSTKQHQQNDQNVAFQRRLSETKSLKQINWKRLGGNGRFGVRADGTQGYIESDKGDPTILSLCQYSSAPSTSLTPTPTTLQIRIKCYHTPPGSGLLPAVAFLVAHHQTQGRARNVIVLVANAKERDWSLQYRTGNTVRVLYKITDRGIRPGSWANIHLIINGTSGSGVPNLTVYRDDVLIMENVELFDDKCLLHSTKSTNWNKNCAWQVPLFGLGSMQNFSRTQFGPPVYNQEPESGLNSRKVNNSPNQIQRGLSSCATLSTQKQLKGKNQDSDNNVSDIGPSIVMQRLQGWSGDGEDRQLIDVIKRDILCTQLNVTFDDIASLDNAKKLLNEAIVLPLMLPDYFIGIREAWKGVLLFGPPGTGKTLLAKAVACMQGLTFFNVSLATMSSKYRGESEKLMRCLFSMARALSPSVVFIDEIDALGSQRGTEGEHEASRRVKCELLSQMDGLQNESASSAVMVLCTTNCPWDIDQALKRRLEKRIYIPLPDSQARQDCFILNMRKICVGNDVDWTELSKRTQGYSGADIKLVCKDASMAPLRQAIDATLPRDLSALQQNTHLHRPIVQEDFLVSIKKIKPSVCQSSAARYDKWNAQYASM